MVSNRPYRFTTRILLRVRPILRWLLKLRSSPRSVAGGFALGTFLAFTPTVGVQLVLALLLATLCNLNRPAAAIPVWITNPVTIPPLFTFNYWVGCQFWSGPSVTMVYGEFMSLAKQLASLDLFSMREQFMSIMRLGWDIIVPLLIGSLLVGAAAAGAVYYLALRLMVLLSRRRQRKKAVH